MSVIETSVSHHFQQSDLSQPTTHPFGNTCLIRCVKAQHKQILKSCDTRASSTRNKRKFHRKEKGAVKVWLMQTWGWTDFGRSMSPPSVHFFFFFLKTLSENHQQTRRPFPHCFNKDGRKSFTTARKNIVFFSEKNEQYNTFSAWDYEVALPVVHWTYGDFVTGVLSSRFWHCCV